MSCEHVSVASVLAPAASFHRCTVSCYLKGVSMTGAGMLRDPGKGPRKALRLSFYCITIINCFIL